MWLMKNIVDYPVQCLSLGTGNLYVFRVGEEKWVDDWMGGKFGGILKTIRKDVVETEIVKIDLEEPIYSIPPENILKISEELKIIDNPEYRETTIEEQATDDPEEKQNIIEEIIDDNIPEQIETSKLNDIPDLTESIENFKEGIVGETFEDPKKLNTNEAWYKQKPEPKKRGRKPKWQK